MIDSMAWASGLTGVAFAISFGVVGVKKAQNSNIKCNDHQALNKSVDEFHSLIRAILVAFSDIASIKQAMIWWVVDKSEDTPEGKALRDKIVKIMMKPSISKEE